MTGWKSEQWLAWLSIEDGGRELSERENGERRGVEWDSEAALVLLNNGTDREKRQGGGGSHGGSALLHGRHAQTACLSLGHSIEQLTGDIVGQL